MPTSPCILLIDNGSARPGATLKLRQLADALSQATGKTIHAVSLQHADGIDVSLLEGQPAHTFTSFVSQQLEMEVRQFIVIPLFFGNSRALSSYIPDQYQLLKQQHGEFELQVCETVYPLPRGEVMLASIMRDQVVETARIRNWPVEHWVVVDHGSPLPQVTEVRQQLCKQLADLMTDCPPPAQAVMERRRGSEYDFNGPLLEDYLVDCAQRGISRIIVAMQFFLPGRHAGEGGDVVEICNRVMQQHPGFEVAITPLIADHPLLIDILAERLISCH